jgi:hypothetical protein
MKRLQKKGGLAGKPEQHARGLLKTSQTKLKRWNAPQVKLQVFVVPDPMPNFLQDVQFSIELVLK